MMNASATVTRGRLFFWLCALLLGNALVPDIVRYVADYGLAQGVADVFGVNALVWVACIAALALLLEDRSSPAAPTSADWLIAGTAAITSLAPTGTVSAAALTAVAIYLCFSSGAHAPIKRAGTILITVSAALLWGRIVLAIFSGTLLRIDSFLVGLLGLRTSGNRIYFLNDAGSLGSYFLVAPGCSSLHSISAAVVFSTVVHAWFGVRPTLQSLLVCLAAIVAVVMVNVLRLGSFAVFPDHFEEIHVGWIGSLVGWATIVVIVGIVGWGMRREIAPRDR